MSTETSCPTCPAAIDLASELAIAQRALDAGDLPHAAFHISVGLVAGPSDARAHALIDAVLARDASFALQPPEEGPEYAGRVALRALLAMRHGDHTAAIGMLVRVHRALPEAGFAVLCDSLFQQPESLRATDPEVLSGAFVALLDEPRAATGVSALLQRLCAAHPENATLPIIEVRLLRQLNNRALAVARCEELVRRIPSWRTLVTLGSTYREVGEAAKAREALLRAAEYNPGDHAIHLDLGDGALEDGDRAAAKAHYEHALSVLPEQPWALASLAYLATFEDESAPAQARLRQLAVEGNARALALHSVLARFDLALEPPGSAIIDVAKLVRRDRANLSGGRVAVTSYEPPSAVRAAALIAGNAALEGMVSFNEIPSPDPRRPRHPVEHDLWTFREPGIFGGLRALRVVGRPVPNPPPQHVAVAVATLALEPWSADTWYDLAKNSPLDRSPACLAQLLAAMVNAPDLPVAGGAAPESRWDIDAWSFRTMVAAAFLIAASPGPWVRSARRTALLSALHGPTDWTTTAAILAIGELARKELDSTDDATSLLKGMKRPNSPVEVTCVQQAIWTVGDWLSET